MHNTDVVGCFLKEFIFIKQKNYYWGQKEERAA